MEGGTIHGSYGFKLAAEAHSYCGHSGAGVGYRRQRIWVCRVLTLGFRSGRIRMYNKLTIYCSHQSLLSGQGSSLKRSMTQVWPSGLRVHLDFDARVLLRDGGHIAVLLITICGIALMRCSQPPLLIHICRAQPLLHHELATASRGQISEHFPKVLRHPLSRKEQRLPSCRKKWGHWWKLVTL